MSMGDRPRGRFGVARDVRLYGLLLVGLGLVAILVPGLVLAIAHHREDAATRQWLRARPPAASGAPALSPAPSVPGAPAPSPAGAAMGTVIPVSFVLRVPKLDYEAGVREGVSSEVLDAGPGHYPTTAAPGQAGNVGIAAHNTYWMRFDRLRRGDQIVLVTRTTTYSYHVTDIRQVSPDDRSVLASTSTRTLTLTTCWPLWAGAAATGRLAIIAG